MPNSKFFVALIAVCAIAFVTPAKATQIPQQSVSSNTAAMDASHLAMQNPTLLRQGQTNLMSLESCQGILTCAVISLSDDTQISPEKRALIKELLTITNSEKTTNALLNQMLAQMQSSLPNLLKTAFANTPNLQGEALQQKITVTASRIFQRYRELLPQRINFAQELEQIQYPIFAKYYTEKELRDLIAFYKTPTGRKVIAVMPQVAQESMQRTLDHLLPLQIKLLQEITQQELRSF